MENYNKFTPVNVELTRAFALAELLTECNNLDVKVKTVLFVQNGFEIIFDGLKGDAIIHDGSYGRNFGMWETYQFPWDYDDVSVHDAKELAKLISALQKGEDWEKVLKGE